MGTVMDLVDGSKVTMLRVNGYICSSTFLMTAEYDLAVRIQTSNLEVMGSNITEGHGNMRSEPQEDYDGTNGSLIKYES